MNLGGIIGGTVAAIIGALLWAGLAYYANIEVGYLALGIGFIVGMGVSLGSKGGGVLAAVVAVVLTILSLVGGKYWAVQMSISKLDSEIPEFTMADEDYLYYTANTMVEEKLEAGESLKFRNGADYDSAETLEDYPKEIEKDARAKFETLTDEDKKMIYAETKAQQEEMIAMFESAIAKQAFQDSFGPIDILFFLLGVGAAGKIALSDSMGD